MEILHEEWLSLVPVSTLAGVYWLRDKYSYNRQEGRWYSSTKTQLQVLLILYPPWIFLTWIVGLQTTRSNIVSSLWTTVGQNIISQYTMSAILNDSFRLTAQQVVGFMLSFLIAFGWTGFWLILHSSPEYVSYVVANHCRCD